MMCTKNYCMQLIYEEILISYFNHISIRVGYFSLEHIPVAEFEYDVMQ